MYVLSCILYTCVCPIVCITYICIPYPLLRMTTFKYIEIICECNYIVNMSNYLINKLSIPTNNDYILIRSSLTTLSMNKHKTRLIFKNIF